MKKRAIVWFRQDLRLHDNEAIEQAIRLADEVIYIYVFDERTFLGKTKFGFAKTGQFRAKFIFQAVQDLKHSLEAQGASLHTFLGKPEEIIANIAKEYKTSWVFCNRERTTEELQVQDALEQKLWTIGQEMIYSRGKLLYHTQDLPFPIAHTPETFTSFRKEVEKTVPIRLPIAVPNELKNFKVITEDQGVTLEDLGHTHFEADDRTAIFFEGGETKALERLQYYLWETDLIKSYKETRNELLGPDYSSKLSPWLAQGCLSPKLVYHELKRYESAKGANESTYWLFVELLWRDYFRLVGKKYQNRIFFNSGIQATRNKKGAIDQEKFGKWQEGTTGVPLIDANMIELKQTGFMSNRGRQLVASFLIHELGLDWTMGADYFESALVDYDVCSNWCNWNYLAGVGTDPREDRHFNILRQAKQYDGEGKYVKHWLQLFTNVPSEKIHQPSSLTASEITENGLTLPDRYYNPIVHLN